MEIRLLSQQELLPALHLVWEVSIVVITRSLQIMNTWNF